MRAVLHRDISDEDVGVALAAVAAALGGVLAGAHDRKEGFVSDRETATLAGGCFWCLEAVFESVRGVESVKSGYAGGHKPDPTYEEVCTGTTGHAEVVQVVFDPTVVSYAELLEIFFAIHDPTILNRQGGDVGTQYRSAVFAHSPEQLEVAKRTIGELERDGPWADPIVTDTELLERFYSCRGLSRHVLPKQSRPALLPRGHRSEGAEVPSAIRTPYSIHAIRAVSAPPACGPSLLLGISHRAGRTLYVRKH